MYANPNYYWYKVRWNWEKMEDEYDYKDKDMMHVFCGNLWLPPNLKALKPDDKNGVWE